MSMSRIFVWLGGGLFVFSLALCAWWYFVVLAIPGQDVPFILTGRHLVSVARGLPSVLVDLVIFGVFAVHHSVFARAPIKAALARIIPDDLMRSVYVWTASLLLIAVVALWSPIGGDLYHVTGWPAFALVAVQISGIVLIARAVAGIDPLELAGIRRQTTRDELQIAGPYAWVRHPLYLGWVIAVCGTPHMTGDRLIFSAITTIYLMMAVPWEERSLTMSYGEEYRQYQRRVRWRIIPYVF